MKKLPLVILSIVLACGIISLVESCQKTVAQTTSTDNTIVIQVPVSTSITTYVTKTDSTTGKTTQVPVISTMTTVSFYVYNLDNDTKTAIPITVPQNVILYSSGAFSKNGNLVFSGYDYTTSKVIWYSYISKTNTLKTLSLSGGGAIGAY